MWSRTMAAKITVGMAVASVTGTAVVGSAAPALGLNNAPQATRALAPRPIPTYVLRLELDPLRP
jgi:hypothetical protein